MPDKTDGSDQLQPESGEPKVDLSPDEIVSKISATYGEGKRVVTLVGYLGQSPEGDEYVRFYPDISLRIYCDIPGDKVILRERVPLIDVPNASKIVVAGDLKLKLVKEAEMEASFLGGAIAAAYSLEAQKCVIKKTTCSTRGEHPGTGSPCKFGCGHCAGGDHPTSGSPCKFGFGIGPGEQPTTGSPCDPP